MDFSGEEIVRFCMHIYGRICENDASPVGVFYGEFGLAILTSDSAFFKRYISRVTLNSS